MIWVLVGVLFLLLIGSIWLNVKTIKKALVLSEQREELIDQIEESLDMLDKVYTNIARNAEIPVLSDEPVIREVLRDITRAKNTVLRIAGKVVIYGKEKVKPVEDDFDDE